MKNDEKKEDEKSGFERGKKRGEEGKEQSRVVNSSQSNQEKLKPRTLCFLLLGIPCCLLDLEFMRVVYFKFQDELHPLPGAQHSLFGSTNFIIQKTKSPKSKTFFFFSLEDGRRVVRRKRIQGHRARVLDRGSSGSFELCG